MAQPLSIDRLARDLQNGETETMSGLFAEAGAPGPLVIWSPDVRLSEHRLITRFAEICDSLSEKQGVLFADRLDLQRFGTMRDWLMQLSCDAAGEFSYVQYGSGVARAYGRDMTGAKSTDFPGHIGTYFTALYQAATLRQERVLSVHQPPDQVFVSTWRRLIVPIVESAEQRKVTGFLALNIPENELRAGLEIVPLPVMILDRSHVVRFANKTAREKFDQGGFGPWDRSIFEYCGLDLEIEESPEAILQSGFSRSRITRHFTHQSVGQFSALISAAHHHDTVFYVVLLNPASD